MNTLSGTEKEKLLAFIDSYSTFIVVGHKEPDGDCISSTLGLASLLNRRQKNTIILSDGPFKRPETRMHEKKFLKTLDRDAVPPDTALFLVDCSTLDRIGSLETSTADFPRFIIDHHKTSSCEGNNCIIDSSAPATAYLIQQIFDLLDMTITKEEAQLLFFGIATDTGFFRFLGEDSGEVFHSTARLIDCGVSPRETYTVMTGGKSFESRRLLGRMLDRCRLYFDGKLIVTWETLEDTCTFGTDARDSDMLYQLLLAIEGVEAVMCIRQDTETACTVGFRSKDRVDVSAVAAVFGGGGHKNAAGLSLEGTIESVQPKLLNEFSSAFA